MSSSTSSQAPQEPEKRRLLGDLSMVQVTGSALAAVSATVAASYLGVAGTVIGAALASVFATAGGTIYTQSLRRTKDVVVRGTQAVRDAPARTATLRHEDDAPAASATASAPDSPPDHTTSLRALADATASLRRDDVHADRDAVDRTTEWTQVLRPVDPTEVVRAETAPDEPPAAVVEPVTTRPGVRQVLLRRWRPLALTAGAIAVVSVLAVTALELAVGHPLSDSSASSRTSVGQLTGGGSSSSDRDDDGTSRGERERPSDATTPDEDATEPTAEPTEPTATPSPGATPSPTPSPTPSATPSPTGAPSATATPRS